MTAALLDRLTHHCEIVKTATNPGASLTAPDSDPGLPRLHLEISAAGSGPDLDTAGRSQNWVPIEGQFGVPIDMDGKNPLACERQVA